jgi:hypothetical protein
MILWATCWRSSVWPELHELSSFRCAGLPNDVDNWIQSRPDHGGRRRARRRVSSTPRARPTDLGSHEQVVLKQILDLALVPMLLSDGRILADPESEDAAHHESDRDRASRAAGGWRFAPIGLWSSRDQQ